MLNKDTPISVQLDQLPDFFEQKKKKIEINQSINDIKAEASLTIEYMWEYSPDRIKLEQLKEKQLKYENEIREHK